jgi:hypothetical protein
MESLDRDTTAHLIKYISPIEAIQLRYLNRGICDIVTKKHISQRFRTALLKAICKTCDVDVRLAKRLLINVHHYRGVISGSIILQALYDVCYPKSDIDIFFPPDVDEKKIYESVMCIQTYTLTTTHKFYNNERINMLGEIYYSDHGNPDTAVFIAKILQERNSIITSEFGIPFKGDKKTPVCRLFYNNKNIGHQESPYKNIQLIKLLVWNMRTPHLSVTNTFDISVVMNSYIQGLETYNIKQLIARTMVTFKGSAPHGERIKKYMDRGFTFSGDFSIEKFTCYGGLGGPWEMSSCIKKYFAEKKTR